mgnify:CR=1 FL=1
MLNMIKMDLYRMVRTKSMYVVWIVMAAAIFFSTSMSKLDIDTMNKEAEQQQTEREILKKRILFRIIYWKRSMVQWPGV